MKLTDKQKRMLDGAFGMPSQVAAELLCSLGTIYDADRMLPIQSAHCAGLSLKSHGVAGMEWAEDMAWRGAKVRVPTTMNVIGVDRGTDLGLPPEWVEHQLRIERAYEAMGCIGLSSCVPYYHGFLPRLGQHVAWAESSAVVFVNSVLGARTNREGGPSAWAAAITGFTPNYGLHLPENRRGDILVKVEARLRGVADYGAAGNHIGALIGDKIPVFEGLVNPSTEELVYLGAGLASAGGVALFHAVGVTPEAPDRKSAFRGKPRETIALDDTALRRGYEALNSGKDRGVDYVALGCPHCSLAQIQNFADLLRGRKVHSGVRLWIHTSAATKAMSTQLGYEKVIRDAGGVITQDLCTILSIPEALGCKTLATHSAKMAFYAPGGNGMDVWYGSDEQCIAAAVTGYWES